MDALLLAARAALTITFAVAAITKIADPAGTRVAVAGFGVPRPLAAGVARLLPVAELAAAALLVPASTARAGAALTAALLVGFCAGILNALARGRTPDCHCFGQLHSEPVGGRTLARNAVLLALAGLVIVEAPSHGGGTSIATWWYDRTLGEQATTVVLAALGLGLAAVTWFAVNLFRQHGRLLVRLDALEARLGPPTGLADFPSTTGLAVGSPAPDFALPGLHGDTVTLASLRARRAPVLLLFTDPACIPCQTLLPDIGRWQRELGGTLTVAVVSRGGREANVAKAADHGVTSVLLQDDQEVAVAYGYAGTPGAVVVGADGTIASPVASGPDAVRDLVAAALGRPRPAQPGDGNGHGHAPEHHHHAPPAGPAIGQPAPDIDLADLDGNRVRLGDLAGRDTLLVFWNPDCGFCQQLLPEMRAFDADPPAGAPQRVFVSTDDLDKNRALELRSPVLRDPGFSVGPRYGANGTPMAVRIDPDGRVASTVAVGGPDVMALARA